MRRPERYWRMTCEVYMPGKDHPTTVVLGDTRCVLSATAVRRAGRAAKKRGIDYTGVGASVIGTVAETPAERLRRQMQEEPEWCFREGI